MRPLPPVSVVVLGDDQTVGEGVVRVGRRSVLVTDAGRAGGGLVLFTVGSNPTDWEVSTGGAVEHRYGTARTFRGGPGGGVRALRWAWTSDTDPVLIAGAVDAFRRGLSAGRIGWSPNPATLGAWMFADAHPGRVDTTTDLAPWMSGQGRFEWINPVHGEECEVWDMRAAYTAHMRGIPLVSSWTTRAPIPADHVANGRWWSYPAWTRAFVSWDITGAGRFGPVPVMAGDRWTWPLTGEGWCSPAELRGLPMVTVKLHKVMVPLHVEHHDCLRPVIDRLDRAVLAAHQTLPRSSPARPVVAGMAKTCKLHLVGKLGSQTGARVEVRTSLSSLDGSPMPADATGGTIEGDELVYFMDSPGGFAGMKQLPVAAEVWARTRATLRQRAERAETERPGTVVALRADALWVRHSLNDIDAGKAGTFRSKGYRTI